MKTARATARRRGRHDGARHCSCPERWFRADPAAFPGNRPATEPTPAGARHTCPTHPQILRDAPGDGPTCGVAREPATPGADAGPKPELADFRRRPRIGGPLAAAVFALETGGHLGLPVGDWFGHANRPWLRCALATRVVVWVAAPFFRRGWASVVGGALNIWTLIALGTGAADPHGVVATLAPGLFPAAIAGVHGLPPPVEKTPGDAASTER